MSFRTIAAGAGMLAALTFVATSTALAETGGTKPSATQPRAAKAPHRAAKPHREAKGRHGKRTRTARHHHRQPTQRTAQRERRPYASAPPETPVPVRHTSAERRFREFLNPESFAGIVNEPLRNPRLLAANFSGDIVDPELVIVNPTTPVGSDPRAQVAPVVARDQTTADDSRTKAAATANAEPAPTQRAAQTEKESDRMSFLRWFFIAWGGVLTLASAVRMAVG